MCNETNQTSMASVFGEVISTYTRAEAIADGVLVEVSVMAKEAGFGLSRPNRSSVGRAVYGRICSQSMREQ